MHFDQPALPIGPKLGAVLRKCYDARKHILLRGESGAGKSEFLAALARDLGIGFISMDLSTMEAPDLLGLPVITNGVTRYAPPSRLPTEGAGLLDIDEGTGDVDCDGVANYVDADDADGPCADPGENTRTFTSAADTGIPAGATKGGPAGCSCDSTPRPSSVAWLALLGLLGLRRR